MLKVTLSLTLLSTFLICSAQVAEEFVKISGRVLSSADSTNVEASLRYEKLPYYDDMGIAKSGTDGLYEFYLVNGTKYNFHLTAARFLNTDLEVLISDEDGDGVMDYDLFIEAEAEEDIPDLITLENLIFARSRATISEASYAGLDELAVYLDENETLTIQLEGHTDFDGNADANMALSQARVEAVKDYLVSAGIKKNRILTKAFGGTEPLYTERTAEAKAKNRRVEARILSR